MEAGTSLNEALDGAPRAAYGPLFASLERMGPEVFDERRSRAREVLRDLGEEILTE